MSAAERASEVSSERCGRTSERRSEWPSTLRVDCIVILPNVPSVGTIFLSSSTCPLFDTCTIGAVRLQFSLDVLKVSVKHTSDERDRLARIFYSFLCPSFLLFSYSFSSSTSFFPDPQSPLLSTQSSYVELFLLALSVCLLKRGTE